MALMGPGVNTENNPNSPFLQNEKGFYICLYADPQTWLQYII